MKLPLSPKQFGKHKRLLAAMGDERSPWFPHWQAIAENFLPRRMPYLDPESSKGKRANARNTKMLDSSPTRAVRTLASGMMNGITSPARPWFRLRVSGMAEDEASQDVKVWLKIVERRMMAVLADSNFYNSMASHYLDWCTFGTAAMAIYQDFDDVIRCYNFAMGEFYISQDDTQRVNRLGRAFSFTVEQIVSRFGEDNLCAQTRQNYKRGGEHLLQTKIIYHIIEKNEDDGLLSFGSNAPYREVYWEAGATEGQYLAVQPLYSWPLVVSRWELHSQDSYGTSPAMDALGDAIELQQLTYDRAVAREKEASPPLIVDKALKNRPKALQARGITYASASSQNFGAKRVYDARFPFQEVQVHQETLKQSIQEACYNQLFNMISQLDTVRSAAEIDARREEKLVLLGPVLERFENEGLDPCLRRIYALMDDAGLFPPPPPELDQKSLGVQYVSVLADAQRAVGTASIERYLTLIGNLAGVYPDATLIPDVEELIRQYAEGIGIQPTGNKSREEVAQARGTEQQNQALANAAAIGKDFAQGAQAASNVDVGGGQNAVQAALGL